MCECDAAELLDPQHASVGGLTHPLISFVWVGLPLHKFLLEHFIFTVIFTAMFTAMLLMRHWPVNIVKTVLLPAWCDGHSGCVVVFKHNNTAPMHSPNT